MRTINADALLDFIEKDARVIAPEEHTAKDIIMMIKTAPTINAIPFDSGYIKQIRWERDIALQQLEEIGCSFGQNMTEIKEKLESSNKESARPRGEWFLLSHCSNAGVYCSNCNKKVFKEEMYYANVKIKSKFCPNCGAEMTDTIKKY